MSCAGSDVALASRRRAALELKLKGLGEELADWRGRSEYDGMPLARHNSQLEAVTRPLDAIIAETEERLGSVSGESAEVIEACAVVQAAVLDVERAWEFFRSRFAQRLVAPLDGYLLVADELAWGCYQPVLAALDDAKPEPPLTFLTGGDSPFMGARGSTFADVTADGPIRHPRVREIVGRLPVPVIGLPWDHLHHVPDVSVVAHEVGHVVEDEGGLGDELAAGIDAALADADADHRAVWRGWAGEAFADAFAAAALGPAYLAALMDFCSGGRASAEQVDPSYPTPTLRVLLCAAVAGMWASESVAQLVGEWRAVYPQHVLAEWETEAAAIGAALVNQPLGGLGGQSVAALVGYGADRSKVAATDGRRRLLEGLAPLATEARVLVAAADEAFRANAYAYREAGVAAAVLAAVAGASPNKRRKARRTGPKKAVADPLLALFPEITRPLTDWSMDV